MVYSYGKGPSADTGPKGDASAQKKLSTKIKNIVTFAGSQKKAQCVAYIPRNSQNYDF